MKGELGVGPKAWLLQGGGEGGVQPDPLAGEQFVDAHRRAGT